MLQDRRGEGDVNGNADDYVRGLREWRCRMTGASLPGGASCERLQRQARRDLSDRKDAPASIHLALMLAARCNRSSLDVLPSAVRSMERETGGGRGVTFLYCAEGLGTRGPTQASHPGSCPERRARVTNLGERRRIYARHLPLRPLKHLFSLSVKNKHRR